MDDLWGEDLPDDVVEECAILASQVSEVPNNSVRNDVSIREDNRNRTALIPSISSRNEGERTYLNKASANCIPPQQQKNFQNIVNVQYSDDCIEEMKKLKEENKRLLEENLVRCGETSILRSDLQHLRNALENQIKQSSIQIDALKKEIKDANGQVSKQQETHHTEMKFKELELEELRTKLKQIEKIGNQSKFTSNSQQVNLLTGNKGFLNRTIFDSNAITPLDRKINVNMIDSAVQTACTRRFCLDTRGIYPTTDVRNIISMFRHLLALHPGQDACHLETAAHNIQMGLEQLKDQDWDQFLSLGGNEIISTFYNNLEHYKIRDDWDTYLKLVNHCMLLILPRLDRSKRDEYLPIILKECEKLSARDMLRIASSAVQNCGFKPVCQKLSGCFLEAALGKFQNSYKSLAYGDALELISTLVITLSTLFSSINRMPEKNCTCISQLLRLLALAVQHQYSDCNSNHLFKFKTQLMTQILRVSLGILSARNEPWLSLVQSHPVNNRLWVVVTTASDIVRPKEVLTEVELGLLSGHGFS